jgi:hypothetical protein
MNLAFIGFWRRANRRLGMDGMASMALALGALLITAWIPTLSTKGDALSAAITVATNTKPATAPMVAISRVPVGQQIGEFVSAFPALSQNSEDLNQVFTSAKRHNIQLPRGDYQFKQDPSAPLVIVTATFPMSADYAVIKEFTADVLLAIPNASMDELRMTRSTAVSNSLEAVVRFSFVYQRQ